MAGVSAWRSRKWNPPFRPCLVMTTCHSWRLLARKAPATGQQVVAPHPEKPLIEAGLQPWPLLGEVPVPGHEGSVIVTAEIVPVLQDETSLHRVANLDLGRQFAVGEDVFGDPGIDARRDPSPPMECRRKIPSSVRWFLTMFRKVLAFLCPTCSNMRWTPPGRIPGP